MIRHLLRRRLLLAAAPVLAFAAPVAAQEAVPAPVGTLMPVSQFTLPNGLRIVFHIDRSDPVVAVALAAHVGSGRELPGRTGFAHMFEHLFFLDSENLGPGGLDRLSARVGGSGANGFTNRDQTIYLQTVPNDALEKMIWAEADKLGYFIGTVTDAVLAKEKQVVKNEKRQGVDNVPYGHAYGVMSEAIYPAGHPYSWSTIGSLADLDAATLADVRAFHKRWYVPNNATLVIAGDFDPAQAKAWVTKYFADIPRGDAVTREPLRPAIVKATQKLLHEDSFAQLPELTLAYPTVPAFHADEWPLAVLVDLLADGPDGPLYKQLVEEDKLASEVTTDLNHAQQAGEIFLSVRAFDGVDLDKVKAAIDAGFARFEKQGVDPAALARVKAAHEAAYYGRYEGVLGKAAAIARYDGFLGKPDFADTELARLRAVTAADVLRVYRSYIAGKPFVATSFVPKGKPALALEGSTVAKIVEEPIVQGAEAAVDAAAGRPAARPKTASSFDRAIEPPAGAKPVVKPPVPWIATAENGLALSGIEAAELPVAKFEIAIDGGRLRDDAAKPGAANLVAAMLPRGTAKRSRADFENALKTLGAEVGVEAGDERLIVMGSTLARNFAATMALVEEMLLEPRWDAAELALAKSATVAAIQSDRAEPEAIAEIAFANAAYGKGHVLAGDPRGTESSVGALTTADLKAYHAGLAPNAARVRIVGAIDAATARAALAGLEKRWTRRTVAPLPSAAFKAPAKTHILFHDVPGAKQSMLLFAAPGPRRADPDFFALTAANFVLGGGGFASRLTQEVREGKGYTYGVRTRVEGGSSGGRFVMTSPVRSNVTLEAATLIRDIMRDYGRSFTPADLDLTRTSMSKSRARSFETLAAKLRMLGTIGDYGLPADYVAREDAVLDALTVDQVKGLATRWIDTGRLNMIVVGDAASQAPRLDVLGYGAPVRVDKR
ncbi:M16 family metallopeptidase [Sphingoaurantiacus capsulatus]|uniref:M16 family metallopeptidase n=1 Tax=Sphingoaurantiacus capsulatus TaxID=1771310 RepID=A0ABV7X855_9SPHN